MDDNRIVTLIDMDCFYCQVETRANPTLKGKPVAVVQYNTWKGGGIIAVNYEARALGINRGMRGDEALQKCPEIKLISVPEVRGKADLTRYRDAGREVIAVLCNFSSCVEKASIDEAYLDLTHSVVQKTDEVSICLFQNTYVVGYSKNLNGTKEWLEDVYVNCSNNELLRNLVSAAALVQEIRNAVFSKTGFHCSAGISHNKILAKLACGINKPDKQTVLPITSVPTLFSSLPLKKIRSLGGKLGESVQEQLGIKNIGEVSQFSLKQLQNYFGEKNGLWLFNMARGINSEPVKPRLISKSIGCCKNFKGPTALTTKDDVKHWVGELVAEIIDRIQDDAILNNRRPTVIVVSIHQELAENCKPISRTIPCININQDEILHSTLAVLEKYNKASACASSWSPALLFLGLSAGKFVEVQKDNHSLLSFFQPIHKEKLVIPACKNSPHNESPISANDDRTRPSQENSSNGQEKSSNDSICNSPIVVYDFDNSFFCNYFACRHIEVKTDKESHSLSNNHDTLQNGENKDCGACASKALCEPSSSTSKLNCNTFEPHTSSSIILNTAVSSENKNCVPAEEREYISIHDEKIDNKSENNNSIGVSCYLFENKFSNDAFDVTEVCAECNQPVRLFEFLEHLDHHVACNLQQQINSASDTIRPTLNLTADHVVLNSISSKTDVRKRKSGKKKSWNSPAKKCVPITSFFRVKPQTDGSQ